MKKIAVALAGAALFAFPAYGQPAQTNTTDAPDQAAKPAAGGAEQEAAEATAPATPKPAAPEGSQPDNQAAPDKPAADSGQSPSR